jgi:endonuclease/exonuclease/phosphatase family metal-dependent hydrolase
MSHRNSKDIEELERSLNLTLQGSNTHIMLGGDFNCPDIDWSNLQVKSQAHDIDVQKAVIDITTNIGMTQVHNEPTRETNLLDLVFTMNPSLIKSSTNFQGISDHAILITDMETKHHYQKTTPRKRYIYSKANWNKVKEDIQSVEKELRMGYTTRKPKIT